MFSLPAGKLFHLNRRDIYLGLVTASDCKVNAILKVQSLKLLLAVKVAKRCSVIGWISLDVVEIVPRFCTSAVLW